MRDKRTFSVGARRSNERYKCSVGRRWAWSFQNGNLGRARRVADTASASEERNKGDPTACGSWIDMDKVNTRFVGNTARGNKL